MAVGGEARGERRLGQKEIPEPAAGWSGLSLVECSRDEGETLRLRLQHSG